MLAAESHGVPIVTTLAGLIGHASAKKSLDSAMRSGRVHHAWIFAGPAGVGKFTAARAFAATLLDPTSAQGLTGEFGPDPDSPVQRLVHAGTHPDLHIITKELAAVSRNDKVRNAKQTVIPKEVLEEFLLEPAARTRAMIGESLMGKAFIVDESELIAPLAQNALLKTLEEPPAGTVIILVTSNEDRLLPTIRSRCQRVAFQALEPEEMNQWVKSRSFDLDAKRLEWVKAFAGGAPGLALLAVECDLFRWHEAVSEMMDVIGRGGYPAEPGGVLAKLIAERAEADVKANPDASKDGANKVWGRRMLAFLAEHFRTSLRTRAQGSSFQGPEDRAVAANLRAIEAVQAAEGYLASNVNLTMLLENLMTQVAAETSPA